MPGRREIAELEVYLGWPLPGPVLEWLKRCNGVLAGPGGLNGWGAVPDFLDFKYNLEMYPSWRHRMWLPVAGDGNGNHFIFDGSSEHIDTGGVFFVDIHESDDDLSYIVGSSLQKFLYFLLESELDRTPWPFGRDFMLARDSMIDSVSPRHLLPWEQ